MEQKDSDIREELDKMFTTKGFNLSVKDVTVRLPEMEQTLGKLRGKSDTYRSEIVRASIRYVYQHPEILKELAIRPV